MSGASLPVRPQRPLATPAAHLHEGQARGHGRGRAPSGGRHPHRAEARAREDATEVRHRALDGAF